MLSDNTQKRNRISILYIVVFLSVMICIYSANRVFGQAMSSGSYKIQSDSLNFGGGLSTSTTYFIQDTVGEVATGESSSSNFKMKAGYQQMQENILSMTVPTDVVMSPSIGGVTGGTSNGSTTFTVITDNPAGYMVTIKASSSPAMQSPLSTIADYVPAGGNPDYTFSITPTISAFGFSVEGNDIDQKFKDNGSSCNTGSGDTVDKCWAGLSTTQQTIVSRNSANQPSGTVTTVKFRAQSGSAHVQVEGIYVSTTTITALSL
jgi:hypothetical protein